jgi:hypothetical protein
MKVATILYHKNILSIYDRKWIEKCFNSVLNQTFKKFAIYELNYGDDNLKLYREYPNNKEYHYYQTKFDNHADAMNFLLNECVNDGFDVVFNNNMDDFSDIKRFETQLKKIKIGYDIVASNFIHIDKDDLEIRKMDFSKLDIETQFKKNNNIIAHPSVCYSKNFLEKNKYISSEIPEEDFKLWKRTIKDYKYHICPQYLINYRIHNNQVSTNVRIENVNNSTIQYIQNSNFDNCVKCGSPKNKVKYNFCQKCNTLY